MCHRMGGCCAVVQSKRRKEMMAMQKKIESGGTSGVGNIAVMEYLMLHQL